MHPEISIKILSCQNDFCKSYRLSFFAIDIGGLLGVHIAVNPFTDGLCFPSPDFERTAVCFKLADFHIFFGNSCDFFKGFLWRVVCNQNHKQVILKAYQLK